MQIQITLNSWCQFFAHTSATVTINRRVNTMSIGLLVVELLVIDDENRICVFRQPSQSIDANSNNNNAEY